MSIQEYVLRAISFGQAHVRFLSGRTSLLLIEVEEAWKTDFYVNNFLGCKQTNAGHAKLRRIQPTQVGMKWSQSLQQYSRGIQRNGFTRGRTRCYSYRPCCRIPSDKASKLWSMVWQRRIQRDDFYLILLEHCSHWWRLWQKSWCGKFDSQALVGMKILGNWKRCESELLLQKVIRIPGWIHYIKWDHCGLHGGRWRSRLYN